MMKEKKASLGESSVAKCNSGEKEYKNQKSACKSSGPNKKLTAL
jgi:hypothetical protein